MSPDARSLFSQSSVFGASVLSTGELGTPLTTQKLASNAPALFQHRRHLLDRCNAERTLLDVVEEVIRKLESSAHAKSLRALRQLRQTGTPTARSTSPSRTDS